LQIPRIWTIALCSCLWAASHIAPLRAGEPPEGRSRTADDTPRAPDEAVKEVQPPVLFLRNKDGGLLQAVLGYTLEDFERLVTQRAQLSLGQQPPRFQLDKVIAHGTANDRQADLTVEIAVLVNHRDWVRVPLRLHHAMLRDKPRYEGAGEWRIEYDPTAQEYVLWLNGDQDQSHRLTLEIAAPLERVADLTEMKLDLPRAAVSKLTLSVADPKAEATIKEGGVLDDTKHTDAATEFTVLGMDRDFAISWQKEGTDTPEAPAPIEATGLLDTQIDGVGVHTKVQLTVRSFGARFDGFSIKLPPGTTLATGEHPDYSIEPSGGEQSNAHASQSFDVRLREKTAGPVSIAFSVDRPHAGKGAEREFEIDSVELVGAARQSGYMAVRVAADWQIAWNEQHQVRRIAELPQELDLDHDGNVACFEYFSQPFSVAGHVLPLETHLSVDPEFTVVVDPQSARLEGRFKYQVRGAKAFALEIAMPGWELDDVTPRNLFDVDRMTVEANKPLRIPLLQPTTGEILLVLRAHRELAADATQIDFVLPRPVANDVGPARLTVTPAANVALTVREADLVGLVHARGNEASPSAAPSHRGELAFRGQGVQSRFVGDLRVESRSLSADIRGRLQLSEKGGQLEETLILTISHEAISDLLVDVPTWLDGAAGVQWQLDGQPITPSTAGAESSVERTVRLRIPFPEKRIGACTLVVRYPLQVDPLAAGASQTIKVPLVMPAMAQIVNNELTVTSEAGLQAELRDDSWTVKSSIEDAGGGTLRLSNSVAASEVALQVRREVHRTADPLVIDRAWIQSRLAGNERWDRAVYLFTGGNSRIDVHLPSGAIASEARGTLDGIAIAPQNSTQGTLTFEVSAARRQHVLDLSYRFAAREKQSGQLVLAAPKLAEGEWVRQTYWQLVFPRDEHLVNWPSDLTGAFQWRLQAGSWGRQPLVEQAQLESWSNASPGLEVSPQTNRYVLTSLGSIENLEVYTASRAKLVMAGAGSVLAAGLLLLYLPALRHPALLFVGGVVLAAGAILFPEPALLIAQVAAMGAALVMVAAFLEHYLKSRRSTPLLVRSSPSSISEPGSTRTHLRAQPGVPGAEPAPLIPEAAASPGES
jgi:hypothetical protein